MDLQSGTIALVVLLALFAVLSARSGLRAIQSARKMTFYRLRQQRQAGGWRMLGLAIVLAGIAVVLPIYALPIAYEYFPPSPTPTLTPTKTQFVTMTITPTITSTPTITDTALFSDTPTASSMPFIPAAIEALFGSAITPDPKAQFSSLSFSTQLSNYQPVNPATVFQNPVGHIYATYSYDNMQPGAQWTALWIRQGQLVHYDTKPFAGGTGGYDYADWNPTADQWLPGIYEVQIFVGLDVKVIGRFLVQGSPPTALPTLTSTPTKVSTSTPVPSLTDTPSKTPRPSSTLHQTSTP